jgi:hypothetical protein
VTESLVFPRGQYLPTSPSGRRESGATESAFARQLRSPRWSSWR